MAKSPIPSPEQKSALLRLNDFLDEVSLKQFPLTLRELDLCQQYIYAAIRFRTKSGRRHPETIIKRLNRDIKIIREANQLLDEDVNTRELANKIKKRLKLSLSLRQIRRIYRGK